jgi:hypothetical protein
MKAILTGALMALMVTTAVRAQTATTLTLACTGTTTGTTGSQVNGTEKVRIGLIVNFQTKQVTGFPGWEADIYSVDETKIFFSGTTGNDLQKTMSFIDGNIDRITGSVWASMSLNAKQMNGKFETILSRSYDLLCEPGQRLF